MTEHEPSENYKPEETHIVKVKFGIDYFDVIKFSLLVFSIGGAIALATQDCESHSDSGNNDQPTTQELDIDSFENSFNSNLQVTLEP